MERRELFGLGLAGAVAGTVGLGTGYRYHRKLYKAERWLLGRSSDPRGPEHDFRAQASRITERQRQQTAETVRRLRAKYESPVVGRFRVWDLLQKLALCVDPTDITLQCTSQYMHVCQILAGMERDGELDETMLLAALLHDLGKVAMLAGEAPEHVVCYIRPVEALEPGGGLDKALLQFGHDEIAYSRFKDYVPEHVAWMLRYHSMVLGDCEPLMSEKDFEFERAYLAKFRRYDQGTKSTAFLPANQTLDRYRDFIESRFPDPILF